MHRPAPPLRADNNNCSRLKRGGNIMMRSTLLAVLVSVALPTMALAQTADELKNDEKTPGDVLTYGMGYPAHADQS
jgi:hypothetical protein